MKRPQLPPPDPALAEAAEVRDVECDLDYRVQAFYASIQRAAAQRKRRLWSSLEDVALEIELLERARDTLARYRNVLEGQASTGTGE